jgi:hypothetical protein
MRKSKERQMEKKRIAAENKKRKQELRKKKRLANKEARESENS